jgi:tetraacyldisaccharide 4'-kinase
MNIKVIIEQLLYSRADEESLLKKLFLLPLSLLSFVYRFLVQSRQTLYNGGILKRDSLPCKVISIGNITLGGTGKTPTVIYLAGLFKNKGVQPVVLSRGYKGKSLAATAVVSDGTTTFMDPQEAGDEPFLLSQALPGVPVIIGPNRALSGHFACEQFSPGVVILDDGFQHQRIKRDVDIVLIDRHHGFGNGYLLPRGILREPLSALGRAHIVLLTKHSERKTDDLLKHQIRRHNPAAPIFKASYGVNSVKTFNEQQEVQLDLLKGKKVLALSGIGNPHYFSFILKQTGMLVTDEWILPDHHNYTEKDTRKALDFLSGVDYIITTAKDSCKMDRKLFHDLPILILEVALQIDEEEYFKDTLFKLIAQMNIA